MRTAQVLVALMMFVGGCLAPDSSESSAALTGPALKAIALTPTTTTLYDGGAVDLTVTGFYADATTRDLTTSATWTTSSAAVATVVGGHVTAILHGSSTITAKVGTVIATAAIKVNISMTSVKLTPTPITQPANTTAQLTATGFFDNGTSKKLTTGVTWTSNDPTVATVTSTGLLVTVAPGTTTIMATATGSSNAPVVGLATVTVNAATLTSMTAKPTPNKMPKGVSQQFTATATFSDATTYVLVPPVVVWSSSNPAIATISATGLATGVAVGGPVTITAQPISGPAGTAALTITVAALASIAVTPKTSSLAAGLSEPFTATGTFTDGTTQDLTHSMTWASSSAFATVSTAGLGHAVSVGVATITATDPKSKKAGTATLTVIPAVLQSIALSPLSPSVPAGLVRQLDALGTWTDGTTQNLDTTATWSSSSPDVASVIAGLVIGIKQGTSTITATDPTTGIAQSVLLTVTPSLLVSIAITPADASVPLDTTKQLTATGTYTDGTTVDITQSVSWSESELDHSSPSGTVVVANAPTAGLVTVVASGPPALITATDPTTGISGQTTVSAAPAILRSLAITPSPVTMLEGETVQLTATGTMSDGSSVGYTGTVAWTSSALAANVTNNINGSTGLVTGARVGDAVVTATDPTSGITTSVAVAVGVRTNDDAAQEFSAFANPVGNWSYGWESAPGAGFNLDDQAAHGNVDQWSGSTGSGNVFAFKNSTGNPQILGSTNLAAGQLALAPPTGAQDTSLSDCRWTAPVDGTFQINASFRGNDAVCSQYDVPSTCLGGGCARPGNGIRIIGGTNETYLLSYQIHCFFVCFATDITYVTVTCPQSATYCLWDNPNSRCDNIGINQSICRTAGYMSPFNTYTSCSLQATQVSTNLLLNGSPILSGEVRGSATQAFATSVNLHAGDTVDFEIGNEGVANELDPIAFDAQVKTCAEAGLTDCGTSCADLGSDVNNCGACNTACGGDPNAAYACVTGACVATCNAGFTSCNGVCVDEQADGNNCGACGNACTTADPNGAASCSAGACVSTCAAGLDSCGGLCVNEQSDANNCGACGNACVSANDVPACSSGQCVVAGCAAGFADCNSNASDGCETSTDTSPLACGSCGVVCSTNHVGTPTCDGGACDGVCDPGFGDCDNNRQTDGCETDLTADATNCGACGLVCADGLACVGGACQ